MATKEEISPPPIKRRRLANERLDVSITRVSSPCELTIYSWNVNGIAPLLQRAITSFFGPSDSKSDATASAGSNGLRDLLRRHRWPTMLFLQEVKVAPSDELTLKAIERAVQPSADEDTGEPSYRAFFSLPRDLYNARGFGRKVYGVCSIIRQDFVEVHVEQVREVDWDLEGRFLVCETKPIGVLPKLAIVNLYAVNGTEAPYHNSSTGERSGTRHDRKLEVHRLLQAECKELQSRGFHIVLAGDFNIARSAIDGHPKLRTFPKQHCVNRADFEAKFFRRGSALGGEQSLGAEGYGGGEDEAALAMVDSFRHLHGDRPGYTYYPRGKGFGQSCDRVDMILLSDSLKGNLAQASIHETPADRGTSDHVPLCITLLAGA